LKTSDWREIAILPDPVLSWLDKPSAVLQISGDQGAGKTSALYALQTRLEYEGIDPKYYYIPEDTSAVQIDFDHPGPLLIDEAQRLNKRMLRGLVKRPSAPSQKPALVYTTHKDYSAVLQRLSIDYETIHLMALDESELARLLECRVRHFAIGSSCEIRFTAQAVHYLANSYRSDLRQMEARLYHFFQAIPSQALITAHDLDSSQNT
jgi:hypothetical protein